MKTFDLRMIYMPYCIQRLGDGRFILLNRRYKPLGLMDSDWIEYETHPSAARIHITPAVARKLSARGEDDLDRIYLYNDGCVPTHDDASMRAFLDRLAVLAKLHIEAD